MLFKFLLGFNLVIFSVTFVIALGALLNSKFLRSFLFSLLLLLGLSRLLSRRRLRDILTIRGILLWSTSLLGGGGSWSLGCRWGGGVLVVISTCVLGISGLWRDGRLVGLLWFRCSGLGRVGFL